MSELVLGRFGDRRLEKGGPIFCGVWLRRRDRAFGSAVLERTVPARFGSAVFFGTGL